MAGGGYTKCPFSYAMFFGTAALVTYLMKKKQQQQQEEEGEKATTTKQQEKKNSQDKEDNPIFDVVFVLGGPGAGKGTQCTLLQQRLDDGTGWCHLSAGDLLRAERKNANSTLGELINSKIASGQLVPSSITVKLLENAMMKTYSDTSNQQQQEQPKQQQRKITKFLIDGFPRSFENYTAWEETMKRHNVKFVLNFECPEEVLVGRLLERGQNSGRSDDNIDVIRKRFQTFQKESLPILKHYEKVGTIVHHIASDQGVEEVYAKVSALF